MLHHMISLPGNVPPKAPQLKLDCAINMIDMDPELLDFPPIVFQDTPVRWSRGPRSSITLSHVELPLAEAHQTMIIYQCHQMVVSESLSFRSSKGSSLYNVMNKVINIEHSYY